MSVWPETDKLSAGVDHNQTDPPQASASTSAGARVLEQIQPDSVQASMALSAGAAVLVHMQTGSVQPSMPLSVGAAVLAQIQPDTPVPSLSELVEEASMAANSTTVKAMPKPSKEDVAVWEQWEEQRHNGLPFMPGFDDPIGIRCCASLVMYTKARTEYNAAAAAAGVSEPAATSSGARGKEQCDADEEHPSQNDAAHQYMASQISRLDRPGTDSSDDEDPELINERNLAIAVALSRNVQNGIDMAASGMSSATAARVSSGNAFAAAIEENETAIAIAESLNTFAEEDAETRCAMALGMARSQMDIHVQEVLRRNNQKH